MVVPTTRPCNVDIEYQEITHCVKLKGREKVILSHVDGKFEHGKLHAIMGPSGAGKSSLLNVLAGLNFVANGNVTMNGSEVFTVRKWSAIVTPIRSYILQDDFMVPELTVRETLMFSAAMNRPQESQRRQVKLVNSLLLQLGLNELDGRRISALSGGQKKRVSVATELVNFKPVLFLDEPTTGLDSASCYKLIDLLKSVAKAGCNVIATIHQPSSRVFTIFDSLTVLATGGRMAFSGPPTALTASVESLTGRIVPHLDNPADFLFDGDIIEKMALAEPGERRKALENALTLQGKDPVYDKIRTYLSNLEGDDAVERKNHFAMKKETRFPSIALCSSEELIDLCENSLPSGGVRFGQLFRRAIVQTSRDIVFLTGRLVAFLLASILIGLLFQFVGKDASKTYGNVAFLFLLSKIVLLGTTIVSIMNSPIHLNILLRESINSWYGYTNFFLARSCIEAIVNMAMAIIFPIALWMMTGQLQDPTLALPYVVVVMCLHSIASHHFAFILAMFSDVQSLPQLPFLIAMINTVFGGYFIPLKDLPDWIYWVRYINWGSFTYSALLKIAYAPLSPDYRLIELPCHESNPDYDPVCIRFQSGRDVLHFWGINDEANPLSKDVLALAMYALGFALAHWALLALYLSKARRAVARL